MFKRLTTFWGALLLEGGPSSTRLINLIVAVTGAWLLYYWARSGGEMSWPWCVAFIAYLAYGAGPKVLQDFFSVGRAKFGASNAEAKSKVAE